MPSEENSLKILLASRIGVDRMRSGKIPIDKLGAGVACNFSGSDPLQEGDTKKPPAFQFYVKDWRSSSTVRMMNREERGTYIDLLALAWENEALLAPSITDIARSLFGYNVRSLTAFLLKFPQTFVKVPAKFGESLVNLKLREQYEETIQFKQRQSLAGKIGNESRWESSSQSDRSAPASAIASASAIQEQEPCENVFAIFWHSYPKKINEAAALRAWVHTIGIHNHIEEILGAIDGYVQSGLWADPKMVPNAENFIKDKRWRDEIPKKAETKNDQRINRTIQAAQRVAQSYSEVADPLGSSLPSGPVGAGNKNLLRLARK